MADAADTQARITPLRTIVVAVSLCLVVAGLLLIVWPAPTPSPSKASGETVTPQVVRGRLVRFTVVRHRAAYDILKGQGLRFRLARSARGISLDGLGRCTVVKRTRKTVVMRSPLHAPLSLTNVHDVVYEGLDFEGAGSGYGSVSGVIFIDGASYNLTFRNCVIGTNQDGTGNGVKIIDFGLGMHDIVFDHCTFKPQPKMGFECIGRSNPAEQGSGGRGYQRVNIIGCTFKPGAGQAISYDDDYSDVNPAGHCLVQGNRILGAGVGNSYAFGSVIENNGVHDMTWKDNYFGAGRDSIVNIQGRDSKPLNMVSTGNVYDASYVAPGISPHNQVIIMHDIRGGVTFADRIINDPETYGATWAYLSDCTGIDFGRSTVENIAGRPSDIYGSGNAAIIWPVKR